MIKSESPYDDPRNASIGIFNTQDTLELLNNASVTSEPTYTVLNPGIIKEEGTATCCQETYCKEKEDS